MKSKSLPGFTAVASLYRSAGSYRLSPLPGLDGTDSAVVQPQLKRQLDLLLCLQGCSLAGSNPACTDTCYRQEHIGASDDHNRPGSGGGNGDSCRPGCGPCRRDPSTRRRIKTCITADCDAVTRAC